MNSLRYLNGILTVIALLLALHGWALFAGVGPAAAHAASGKSPTGGGIPNAGAQRKQTVDMLKRISQQMDGLTQMFRTGQARVRLEGVNVEEPKRD